MIKFSLSRILEESPYNLILSGTDFRFITDFGIHYSVSFNKEDIVLGECETYQLIIRKIDEIRSKHDPKVEKTILAIIDEFLFIGIIVENRNPKIYDIITDFNEQAKLLSASDKPE